MKSYKTNKKHTLIKKTKTKPYQGEVLQVYQTVTLPLLIQARINNRRVLIQVIMFIKLWLLHSTFTLGNLHVYALTICKIVIYHI